MDIRVVETMATTGGLADVTFRADPDIENVSLDWNEADGRLAVVDYNMNYNILPYQLYGDMVKKVFLTYNGKNQLAEQLIETVVMESKPTPDLNFLPGYNNSNEWYYTPKTFSYPNELLAMTDISQFVDSPYDWSAGFTVVKQFLTSSGTISPYSSHNGQPAYTAYYRAPTLTSFLPANVEGNRLYTDGWYTSYICLAKKWSVADPINNGIAEGDILYFEDNESFYINLTGTAGTLVTLPNEPVPVPDPDHWRKNPNFQDWKTLMSNNLGPTLPGDPVYFIESQHLVTIDINKAILSELKRNCVSCTTPEYNMSRLNAYIKLTAKRMGAWVQFNSELFHEAAEILATARPVCNMCLYHNDGLGTPRPLK